MNNQSLNTFSQNDMVGRLDLHGNPNTFSAHIDNGYTGDAVLVGQAVKLVPASSRKAIPDVVPVENASDQLFGFVTYDQVHRSFAAGRPANISRTSNVINLISTGAIVQGSTVKMDIGTLGGVSQSEGPFDRSIGHAIDGASASGQIIRVYLNIPDYGAIRAAGPGVLVHGFDQFLLPVQLATGASAVIPGSLVEMVDGTQAVPNVSVVNDNADVVVGVVVDSGQGNQDAEAFVLIAQTGSTVYLDATAAFNRGTQVCVDQASAAHVTVSTAGRTIVGYALDKAAAGATNVRIRLNAPSFAVAS